jgi:flagellar hook-associated protein FlgK
VIDALNIAASGLQAATAQLNVAANNIANMNTPGYTAESVDLGALPSGGVQAGPVLSTGQSLDLPRQWINLKQAALMYDANGIVIKTTDQMYGSLLNVLENQNDSYDQNQ